MIERGRTFDTVATLYDAHRSGYPDALFADISAIAGLESGDRVLELGCGSGQATIGFVARGLDVTAIDPGAALVDLARQRFAHSRAVQLTIATFEEWPLPRDKFHLVAAAQSWHWIRPEVGLAKAAEALVMGGHLAIFGHTPRWSADLIAWLRPAYSHLAPEMWAPPPENWYLPEGPVTELIAASGRFGGVVHRAYAWRRRYAARSFTGYLATRSDHGRLPGERRDKLLASIEASLPPEVEADWVTNLYVATARKS